MAGLWKLYGLLLDELHSDPQVQACNGSNLLCSFTGWYIVVGTEFDANKQLNKIRQSKIYDNRLCFLILLKHGIIWINCERKLPQLHDNVWT